jgi:hypothetical protein
MKRCIRGSLAAIPAAGALALFGGLAVAPANAATQPTHAPAHTLTARAQSPNGFGVCYMHWQDGNGNSMPYSTFTCLLTPDVKWRGYVTCTDGSTTLTKSHIGGGYDMQRCPSGVVVTANVIFL